MEFDKGDTIKFENYPGKRMFKGIVKSYKSFYLEDEFGRKSVTEDVMYDITDIKPKLDDVGFISVYMWQLKLTRLVLIEKWKKNLI